MRKYKKIKYVFFILNFVILTLSGFSQKRNLDSLNKIINGSSDKKIITQNLIHVWWWYYQEQQHEKSLQIINKARTIALSISDSGLVFSTTGNLAIHYGYLKNYGASIFYFKQARKYIPNDKKTNLRKIGLFNNLSECYYNIADYANERNYLDSCVKINNALKNPLEGFYLCSAIAKYYLAVKNYNRMFFVLDSALTKLNAPKWDRLATGIERLKYVFDVYSIDTLNKSNWLNKSVIYFSDYTKILNERGEDLTQLELNRDWILRAKYYLLHKDLKTAEKYCDKLEEANKTIFSPEFNVPYMKLKFYLNINNNKSENAGKIFDKLQLISDSVELALHKNHALSIESFLNGQAELEKEKLEKNEKILMVNESKKTNKLTILYGSTLLIILTAGLILLRKRFVKEKKQHKIISKQKELVDEKQKEITDSINYAKRIQSAMLAPEALLKQHLKNYFLYFNPKDIVSGDFYWACAVDDYFFIAICDSTGHGVPGSFMSLINTSYLNEAINEKKIIEPNDVFNHVRMRLINTLSTEGQKDGFDGVLLRLNLNKNELVYAAANNAPVLVRNKEIIALKKDRMPVGKGEVENEFTRFEISITKQDMLYVYTDGYADQFGGEKGKKFKNSKLLELFLETHKLELCEQKNEIEKTFVAWKMHLEQVDDVCVFGIKL